MSTTESTDLTFENGYGRLQAIATRLGEDEVPVSEMVDLYAEGKGLEVALLAHLDEAKGRIETIEQGDGVQQFRIVATSSSPQPAPSSAGLAAATADFAPAPAGVKASAPTGDDIPF